MSLLKKMLAQAEATADKRKEELLECKVLSITIAPPVKEYARYRVLLDLNGVPTNVWVFQSNVAGADDKTFIPKAGMDAIVSVVPNQYKDKQGADIDGFQVRNIKIDSLGAQYAQLAAAGITSINLAKAS